MMDFVILLRNWIFYGCVIALSCLIGFLFIYGVALGVKTLSSQMVQLFRRSVFRGLMAVAALVGFIVYGGTKPATPSVSWDTGFKDTRVTLTENVLQFSWGWEGLPADETVYIDYRPKGGAEWGNLTETTVGAAGATVTVEDALSYEFFVFTLYTPSAPVHTNGVWVGKAYKTRSDTEGFIVIQSTVTDNGKVIATPEKKVTEEK